MAFDVDGTHEDRAVETEQRRRRRGRNTVLARAGLGDHALLPHALREQALPQNIVDLVRTRVREVLALEQHAHTQTLGEPLAVGDRSRPTRVRGEQLGVLRPEPVVVPRGPELTFELFERGDERLGCVTPAVLVEPAEADRLRAGRSELYCAAAHRDGHGHSTLGET